MNSKNYQKILNVIEILADDCLQTSDSEQAQERGRAAISGLAFLEDERLDKLTPPVKFRIKRIANKLKKAGLEKKVDELFRKINNYQPLTLDEEEQKLTKVA